MTIQSPEQMAHMDGFKVQCFITNVAQELPNWKIKN